MARSTVAHRRVARRSQVGIQFSRTVTAAPSPSATRRPRILLRVSGDAGDMFQTEPSSKSQESARDSANPSIDVRWTAAVSRERIESARDWLAARVATQWAGGGVSRASSDLRAREQ